MHCVGPVTWLWGRSYTDCSSWCAPALSWTDILTFYLEVDTAKPESSYIIIAVQTNFFHVETFHWYAVGLSTYYVAHDCLDTPGGCVREAMASGKPECVCVARILPKDFAGNQASGKCAVAWLFTCTFVRKCTNCNLCGLRSGLQRLVVLVNTAQSVVSGTQSLFFYA
jgi:hypothetical protein